MTDTIAYAVEGNVARITLDDGKLNTMSPGFFAALGAALDRAEREKPGAVVIAGRAILAFACDLRYAADGPFRLQLNEVAIGMALPTWAMVIAETAVPPRWQTEAFLHARAYSPADALARSLVTGVVPPDRLLDEAASAAARLGALHQAAYATSKTRLRAMAVEWALARLEPEMAGRPSRA